MKVFVGDPWARVVYQQGLKGILNDLGPRMGVSIGLGSGVRKGSVGPKSRDMTRSRYASVRSVEAMEPICEGPGLRILEI